MSVCGMLRLNMAKGDFFLNIPPLSIFRKAILGETHEDHGKPTTQDNQGRS